MAHRLEFSEFTFGFALTENFGRLGSVKAVPIFPSLIDEGKKGGGFDVAMHTGGELPLLLQFKVPQVVNRRSALMPSGFPRPYYRAHLRCRPNDDGYSQHSVLLEHERNGHDVYYATPRFHQLSQLDALFMDGQVVAQSAFFRPGDVGDVSDEPHHVAYCAETDDGWLRSDPVKLPHPVNANVFLSRLQEKLVATAKAPMEFDAILESLVMAAERGVARSQEHARALGGPFKDRLKSRAAPNVRRLPPRVVADRLREGRTPRVAAALFARLWLDSELLVVVAGAKSLKA